MTNREKIQTLLKELVEHAPEGAGTVYAALQGFLDGAGVTDDEKAHRFSAVMVLVANLAARHQSFEDLLERQIERLKQAEALHRLKKLLREGKEIEA